jgi:hypothetical protein
MAGGEIIASTGLAVISILWMGFYACPSPYPPVARRGLWCKALVAYGSSSQLDMDS